MSYKPIIPIGSNSPQASVNHFPTFVARTTKVGNLIKG
jgi:hypothetical protein